MAAAELSAVQAKHDTESFALRKNGVDEVALLHIGAWANEPSGRPSRAKVDMSHKEKV